MGRQKKQSGKTVKRSPLYQVPDQVEALRSRATEQRMPPEVRELAEGEQLNELLQILCPSPVVQVTPGGHEKTIWREPLLMVSWDRAAGAWRWNVSDRTIQYSVRGFLPRLEGLLEAIRGQLQLGTVEVRSTD